MARFKNALGREVNPWLGVLILSGCLMTGHPALAVAPAPNSAAVARAQTAAPIPASLASGNENTAIPHSSVASSTTEVLHAALATALAAAWLMGGAWVGIRSARSSTPSR
jgi:hypothetical protein